MGKHETMLGSTNLATWSMAATSLMQSLTRLAPRLRREGSVQVLSRDGGAADSIEHFSIAARTIWIGSRQRSHLSK